MSPKKTTENPLGLAPVDGMAVIQLGMEISNAAGGLNPALELDDSIIELLRDTTIGDTKYALLRIDKVKVRYQPAKKQEDKLRRVDIFRCTDATIVDSEWAVNAIHEQQTRLQRLRDEAEGKMPLFGEDGEPMNPEQSPGLRSVPNESGDEAASQ